MIYWATNQDVENGKKVFSKIKERYLPILDLVGKDLLGDYKAFELPYIISQVEKYKPKTILDVGTGTSCLPAYLSDKGYNVWCLDLPLEDGGWHPEVTETNYNQTYQTSVRYVKVDLTKRPNKLPDNYFDLIYSVSTLEHVTETQELLETLQKKLSKNGKQIHVIDYEPSKSIDFNKIINAMQLKDKVVEPENYYQPENGIGRIVISNELN